MLRDLEQPTVARVFDKGDDIGGALENKPEKDFAAEMPVPQVYVLEKLQSKKEDQEKCNCETQQFMILYKAKVNMFVD